MPHGQPAATAPDAQARRSAPHPPQPRLARAAAGCRSSPPPRRAHGAAAPAWPGQAGSTPTKGLATSPPCRLPAAAHPPCPGWPAPRTRCPHLSGSRRGRHTWDPPPQCQHPETPATGANCLRGRGMGGLSSSPGTRCAARRAAWRGTPTGAPSSESQHRAWTTARRKAPRRGCTPPLNGGAQLAP